MLNHPHHVGGKSPHGHSHGKGGGSTQQNSQLDVPCYWVNIWSRLNDMRMYTQLCDIKLASEDGTSLRAHSAVLAASSEVFHGHFTLKNSDVLADTGNNTVLVRGISGEALQITLDFVYGVIPTDSAKLSMLLEGGQAMGITGALIFCRRKNLVIPDSPVSGSDTSEGSPPPDRGSHWSDVPKTDQDLINIRDNSMANQQPEPAAVMDTTSDPHSDFILDLSFNELDATTKCPHLRRLAVEGSVLDVSQLDQPSTAQPCRPPSTKLDQQSTAQLCQPSTGELNRPSTTQLDQPSTTQLDQPSTTQLDQPSTTQLCQPSSAQLDQPLPAFEPPITQLDMTDALLSSDSDETGPITANSCATNDNLSTNPGHDAAEMLAVPACDSTPSQSVPEMTSVAPVPAVPAAASMDDLDIDVDDLACPFAKEREAKTAISTSAGLAAHHGTSGDGDAALECPFLKSLGELAPDQMMDSEDKSAMDPVVVTSTSGKIIESLSLLSGGASCCMDTDTSGKLAGFQNDYAGKDVDLGWPAGTQSVAMVTASEPPLSYGTLRVADKCNQNLYVSRSSASSTVTSIRGSTSTTPYSIPFTRGSTSTAPYSIPPTRDSTSTAPYSIPPTRGSTSTAPYSIPPTRGSTSTAPYSIPPTRGSTSTAQYSIPPTRGSTSTAPYSMPLTRGSTSQPVYSQDRIFPIQNLSSQQNVHDEQHLVNQSANHSNLEVSSGSSYVSMATSGDVQSDFETRQTSHAGYGAVSGLHGDRPQMQMSQGEGHQYPFYPTDGSSVQQSLVEMIYCDTTGNEMCGREMNGMMSEIPSSSYTERRSRRRNRVVSPDNQDSQRMLSPDMCSPLSMPSPDLRRGHTISPAGRMLSPNPNPNLPGTPHSSIVHPDAHPGHMQNQDCMVSPDTLQRSRMISPDTLQRSRMNSPDTLQRSRMISPETLQRSRMNSPDTHSHHRIVSPDGFVPADGAPGYPDNNLIKARLKLNRRQEYSCLVAECNYSNKCLDYMQSHMYRKHELGSPDVKCITCAKSFFSVGQMRGHVKRAHRVEDVEADQEVTCDDCSQVFSNNQKLQTHRLKSHFKGRLFTCQECDFRSPRKKDVQAHMVSQHDNVPPGVQVYTCTHCEYKCTDKNRAEEHQAMHSGQPKFVCRICGKSYTTRRGMRTHMQYHSQERPHQCETCNAAFKVRSKLRDHIRLVHTHVGVKPYECGYCGHRTALRGNCNQHCRKHHISMPVLVIDHQSGAKHKNKRVYDYAGLQGDGIEECKDIRKHLRVADT